MYTLEDMAKVERLLKKRWRVVVIPAVLMLAAGIALFGRMRETTGVLKSFSEDVSDREGLECHAMMLNVGERDDPEDDRLFYFDALKPWPGWAMGTRLTVKSNDKLVASITEG